MAGRKDLEQLRAERMKAERLNRAKASRIARAHGVNVSNLKESIPRQRTRAEINRMTKATLEKELRESEFFRQRTTSARSFVKLGDNTLIHKQQWMPLQSAMNRRNRQITLSDAEIDNMHIPYIGMTIGEYYKMTTPDRAHRMENDLGFSRREVSPNDIAGVEGLKRYTDRYEKMNRSGDERLRARNAAMGALDKVFDQINEPGIAQRVRGLSTNQFFAFWKIRLSANDLFAWYVGSQQLDNDQMSAEKLDQIQSRHSDYKTELGRLLDDIEQLGR